MGEQRVLLTSSNIAEALKISRSAVNAKVKRQAWQSATDERVQGGGFLYDIDEIPLTYKERQACRRWHSRKNGAHLRIVPSAVEQQAKADEKERLRLEARAQSLATFARLPEWQQRGARAKLEIMSACEAFIVKNRLARTAGQDDFAVEYSLGRIDVAPWVQIPTFHPATLRDWISKEYNLGMMGLVDLYGNRKGQSKIETYITGTDENGNDIKPMVNMILAVLFEFPHLRYKGKAVNEILQAKLPDAPWVSDKSVKRWIDGWVAAHEQEWEYAKNPDSWKNKYLTAMGQIDEKVRYIPNARWEIDATPADLLLTDGRNKIIGLIDVGTRRLILQVTPTEKALDNAKVVRRGILAWGVPAEGVFITDQGNPYKAELFERFLDGLDIGHEFCPAFSGDRKPFIERSFRTFSHDLVEVLPGYCGHSVADRKAIESRKSFAQRLMKKGEVIEVKMTAAELQQFCDRWCASYHDREHSTLGKSPNQVVAEWPHAIHRIADERALDVLLSPVAGDDGWRTVTKKGVKIDKAWYVHGEFGRLNGERVLALETDDIGRVIVNRRNEFGIMEFIGIAECPERTGISRAEVAAVARERQKRVIAEVNVLKRELKKELKGEDIAGAVLRNRERKAAEARGNVSHLPSRTKEYTTPGLAAAGEAAALLDRRGETPQVTPEAEAIRERFQAELAAPKQEVFEIPVGDPAKYRLWCELDGLLCGGIEVSEEAERFYHAYKKSPYYKFKKGIDADIYSLRKD